MVIQKSFPYARYPFFVTILTNHVAENSSYLNSVNKLSRPFKDVEGQTNPHTNVGINFDIICNHSNQSCRLIFI